MRCAAHTLGCKLNFAETSHLLRRLTAYGHQIVDFDDEADLYIINTCTVTAIAEKKCRTIIRQAIRRNPGAQVAVIGCFAQNDAASIARIPGVTLILGNDRKHLLPELIANEKVDTEATTPFPLAYSSGDRTRSFLKIQDGCDYFCTYCTIPFARGFSRNPTIDSLVEQARQAAADGGKEIVLTGVNIGDFGKTTGEQFIDLVKALDGVEGICRYRISSLEPDLLTDDLIDYCANHSRAFMPHFHIPLQSGSDTVLRLMHRHYDCQLFAEKILKVKQLMPDAFIGVDVMVGCRGETPECFEETRQLLESLPVTQLHVFPYSERPGTAALKIPYIVTAQDKRQRSKVLLELSEQKTHDFYAAHIGQEAEVLFEKAPRGKAMHGFSRNYIRVELPPAEACPDYDNQLLRVRLGEFNASRDALKVSIVNDNP